MHKQDVEGDEKREMKMVVIRCRRRCKKGNEDSNSDNSYVKGNDTRYVKESTEESQCIIYYFCYFYLLIFYNRQQLRGKKNYAIKKRLIID